MLDSLNSSVDDSYMEALKLLFERYGKSFRSGEKLVREDELGNDIYFLYQGHVKVSIGQGSHKRELWTLNPGDIFGEMALLDELARTATVEALDEVHVVVFEREKFFQLISRYPILARRVIELMGKRMRKMDTQYKIELGYVKGQQMGQQLDW